MGRVGKGMSTLEEDGTRRGVGVGREATNQKPVNIRSNQVRLL